MVRFTRDAIRFGRGMTNEAFSDISAVHDGDAVAIAGEVALVVRARVKAASALPSPEDAARLRSAMLREVCAGRWDGYTTWLAKKARQYAADDVPLNAWYEVTVAFTRAMIRRLGEAFPGDGKRVAAAMLALQEFGDRGMETFSAEYNRARDELFERNAEARLLAESRFRILSESGVVGIIAARIDGTILEVNSAVEAMLGYSRDDIVSGRVVWSDLTPPEWKDTDARAVENLETRGSALREKEYVHKDGHRVPVVIGSAMTDATNNELLSFVLDISDRKKAERALRQSASRFRSLIEHGRDGIVLCAEDATVTYASATARRILGFDAESPVGNMIDLVHAEDKDLVRSSLGSLLARPSEPVSSQFRIVRPDGAVRFIDGVGSNLLADPAVRAIVGNFRDVTENKIANDALKKSEDQIRQMQKMEAVGNLAGGIAHDFNNLLSVIISYSHMILEQLPAGDSMRDEVDEIRRAGVRAEELTRQLLAFSRKQILQPTVVDVNAIIGGVERLTQRLIGEHIELSLKLARDLWRTHADAGQIEQVLLNLVINARDAMPKGGKLTIETSNARLDTAYTDIHPQVTPGEYVMFAVTDNGVGMDAEVQRRAFEPFFTTKGEGKGTGLGLATVFGIVKQSGGHVWLYSEVGYGTTFKVYLPRTDKSAQGAVSREAPRLARGTETILVIEDEPQVRGVTRTILRRAGYDVLEARDGVEAIALVEKHEGPIHLVVTDVVMPKMSGRDVVQKLAPMRPSMKVLYVSGYTEDAIVDHGVLESGIHFLPKPLMPEALLRKVREILDDG